MFPSGAPRWIKTGTNGSYSLTWSLTPVASRSGKALLVVRDPARNLAMAADLPEETTNLDVQLKPALTLAGRVEDPDGAPLVDTQVAVRLRVGNVISELDEELTVTDAQGRFEIKSLPVETPYQVIAKAKGRSLSLQKVQTDAETNRVELTPFVLRLADCILAGQVVNQNDKPVSGVNVSLAGEDQPEGTATTDSKGRFRLQVCAGKVRLFASSQNGFAQTAAEAGDTNVIIQLSSRGSVGRSAPLRASLKGKPLPDLTGLNLATNAAPAGQRLLVCLFDLEQRPSRRLVRLLAEQHDTLKQKGLTVLAVQAAVTTAEALQTWKDESPVPFPVGRVPEKSDRTRWVSAADSLPWLILTDAEHRVVAEGFALDELEAKLKPPAK